MAIRYLDGTLYGIGLGPGAADLMTLRAQRLLRACPVLAYPQPDSGPSFARSIASDIIPAGIVEIPIVIPMRPELYPATDVYDRAARDIAEHLAKGRDVALLCQGDPLFYGSFLNLQSRLAKRCTIKIVPGVSSLTACAASAGRPLCARNDSLMILPATLDSKALGDHIAAMESCVIIKVGRHLRKIRALLAAEGLLAQATLIIHASLPGEQVMPLAEAPDNPPYFSTILVSRNDDPQHG